MKALCGVLMLLLLLCGGVQMAAGLKFEQIDQWGEAGSLAGQFIHPGFVAFDEPGTVYVVDTGNERVQKFTSDGTYVMSWVVPHPPEDVCSATICDVGPGENLGGIAVDSAGNVYIGTHRFVEMYTSWGWWLQRFKGSLSGSYIYNIWDGRGVAVDVGDTIYVVQGDDRNPPIYAYLAQVHIPLMGWGGWGSSNGQFVNPQGIAIDRANNLVYVADAGNHRVQRFSASGVFLDAWGSSGTGNGQFRQPYGVAVDASGNVYVTDLSGDAVTVFSRDGMFITKWAVDSPAGIAVDPLGSVYVASTSGNRVEKYGRALLAIPVGVGAFPRMPMDTDSNGLFEDVNGNLRQDFADVVLYFNQMTWIAANQPVTPFDYNMNRRIDFADVVWLFNHL